MIAFCMKKRVYFVVLSGACAFLLLMCMMSAAYSSTVAEANRARIDTPSSYNSQPTGSSQLAIPAQGGDSSLTPAVKPATLAQGNEMLPTTSAQGNEVPPVEPTQPVLPVRSISPAQGNGGAPQSTNPAQGSELPPVVPLPVDAPPPPLIPVQGGAQQNNQSFHGISNSANQALLIGHNEGNTGNQGVNRGFTQDNGVDSGNQVSSQRKAIGVQQNDQLISGDGSGSNSGNSSTNIGFNQGNSGNEGINLGHNQDNAGNSGNQVNNQANVIGTQVNNQGTVNNDHNIIEHQINYVRLLPNVGLYLSLHPKVTFAVSLGK